MGIRRERAVSKARALGTKRNVHKTKETAALLRAAHQFGLVGGEWYDSKQERLAQLLERLMGSVLILVSPRSLCEVQVVLAKAAKHMACESKWKSQELHLLKSRKRLLRIVVAVDCSVPSGKSCGFDYLVHYDVPRNNASYVRHLMSAPGQRDVGRPPSHVYTMVTYEELQKRACMSIGAGLKIARKAAETAGDRCKATELLVSLQNLGLEQEAAEGDSGEDEAEEEEAENQGMEVESLRISEHFAGQCSVSYHSSQSCAPAGAPLTVEFVRIPLRALKNLNAAVATIIKPGLAHKCTIICCHNLNCLDPWDRHEHLFSLPKGMGPVRVVQVLADDGSYHDYPDLGSYESGVVWLDFIDAPSILATDALLERLQDFETKLLGDRSERVFFFGKSQGGGQALLRFIRSKRKLGGYIGGMCHVPTSPHLPRDADAVAAAARATRPAANAASPVRLLCGEADTTFPPPLVLRDAERLRTLGLFKDVKVKVMPGMTHEDLLDEEGCYVDINGPPPELTYLRKQLPAIISAASSAKNRS